MKKYLLNSDKYFIAFLSTFILYAITIALTVYFTFEQDIELEKGIFLLIIIIILYLILGMSARAMLYEFSVNTTNENYKYKLSKKILLDPSFWGVVLVIFPLAIIFAFSQINNNLSKVTKIQSNYLFIFGVWISAGFFIPFWYLYIKTKVIEYISNIDNNG